MAALCKAGADLAVPDMDAAPVFVNLAGGTRFAPWRPESVSTWSGGCAGTWPGRSRPPGLRTG